MSSDLMVEPTHIYICGPMRGYAAFNFPAFFAMEAALRRKFPSADVCNPAREDVVRFNMHDLLRQDPTGYMAGEHLLNTPGMFTPESLRTVMSGDLHYVTNYADLLVALPGWEDSKGAKAEVAAAEAVGVQWVTTAVFDTGDAVEDFDSVFTREEFPSREDFPEREQPTLPEMNAAAAESLKKIGQRLNRAFGKAETRTTASSGGQKGVKAAQFDQIPPESIWALAEHFGKGAAKYSAHNFRKGYPWSWSYNAALRHFFDFWAGRDYDVCPADEAGCAFVTNEGEPFEPFETEHGRGCYNHTGSHHLDAFMWHGHVLRTFYDEHKEYDDRYATQHD